VSGSHKGFRLNTKPEIKPEGKDPGGTLLFGVLGGLFCCGGVLVGVGVGKVMQNKTTEPRGGGCTGGVLYKKKGGGGKPVTRRQTHENLKVKKNHVKQTQRKSVQPIR